MKAAILFLLVLSLLTLSTCQQPAPIFLSAEQPFTIAPALVSIQPVAVDQAEIVVKAGFGISPTRWRLNLMTPNGQPTSLSASATERNDRFELTLYRATGLSIGQTYRLQFGTQNAAGDSINVERVYTHQPEGPRWIRLAHAPLERGDFSGSALSIDNIPKSEDFNYASVNQNGSPFQQLLFDMAKNQWIVVSRGVNQSTTSSHHIVRYRLQAVEGVNYNFGGLGFLVDEGRPGQRQYSKVMFGGGLVVPYYAGPDGELRWFTTLDRAYQLTEGSQQVWVRRGTWEQYRAPDLPEPTGTLATFRMGKIGYVVNQRVGQPIHLWAFDTQTEQWRLRADFPGPARSRGVGFSAGGQGYFGLGVNAREETLRDVWQYDPQTDQWQYRTQYPGAGSTDLAVAQMQGRVLLGWGYEQQTTRAGGIRLIGCSDWWEFTP